MYIYILTRYGKLISADQSAVSSIEYALIASLIAMVIVGSVALVGDGTLSLWSRVQNCVSYAVNQSGNCP